MTDLDKANLDVNTALVAVQASINDLASVGTDITALQTSHDALVAQVATLTALLKQVADLSAPFA